MTISYNQNRYLVANSLREARAIHALSILDIGAGSPMSAVQIASSVSKYLAIEVCPDKAQRLRSKRLNVICDEFPCHIECKYDLVIASHSMPSDPIGIKVFVDAAWQCVEQSGRLVLVTFSDPISNLFGEDLRHSASYQGRRPKIEILRSLVSDLGESRHYSVHSFLSSDSEKELADEIIKWDSRLSDNVMLNRDAIIVALQRRFKVENLFHFPIQHDVFTADRY